MKIDKFWGQNIDGKFSMKNLLIQGEFYEENQYFMTEA